MPRQPDVLILGGGVIGLTIAYVLSKNGLRVSVLDKGDFGQESSWAGAGILSAAPSLERAQGASATLAAHSARLFPELTLELQEQTGIDTGYRQCGGIEVLGLPRSRESFDENAIVHEWNLAGIPHEKLTSAQLTELEPRLDPRPHKTCRLPTVGQVRNPRHLKALRIACERQGVSLHPHTPVLGVDRDGSRIRSVHAGFGTLSADKYLVTSGAWTDGLLAPIGVKLGIRPVRGQIVLLSTGAPLLNHVILCGKRYLVPRGDGRVLVGSTEEDAGFQKQTTATGINELLTFACALVPKLGEAALEKCWAGLRPGSPDGRPFLGAVRGVRNLYVASGHFRAGIQLSPGTAMVMKELFLDQPLTIPLEHFRLDRFFG